MYLFFLNISILFLTRAYSNQMCMRFTVERLIKCMLYRKYFANFLAKNAIPGNIVSLRGP